MNIVNIDLSNLDECRKLMEKFGDETDTFFVGNNNYGEITHTSITKESIVMETYQTNGWIRENWLHYDGTREELFNGKWNKKIYTVTLEIEASNANEVRNMIDKIICDDRTISFNVEENS